MSAHFTTFKYALDAAHDAMRKWGTDVPVNRWQGVETEGTFRELLFWNFEVPVVNRMVALTTDIDLLQHLREDIQPNLPWADDHFAERVGGFPDNPGKEYQNWPYWREESSDISLRADDMGREPKFSHTYMERFWPKHAAPWTDDMWGIRYRYGDLQDVVDLLFNDPYTRQAYVPIWFPEDTGAVHKERVPCSIGYFFIMRSNRLHMRYHIRSCDFNRYLRDDIYMAVRLQLWMLEQLQNRSGAEEERDEWAWEDVTPGTFLMDIDSLHVIGGDFSVR